MDADDKDILCSDILCAEIRIEEKIIIVYRFSNLVMVIVFAC